MGSSTNIADAHVEMKIGPRIQAVAFNVLRYGLILAIAWIAAMKGTEYEAKGIQPLIAHSPFLSWGYSIWTVRQFTAGIGVVELIIATLIALRPWSPRACAIGSAGAVLMFLTTLSFLFSTPGWEPSLGGFPALSGDVGEFLIKDVVLLGAALWSLGEAMAALGTSRSSMRSTQ
jgi:reactive chlorine resistance protein C